MTPTRPPRERHLLLPQPPAGLSLDDVPAWAAQQGAQTRAAVCVLDLRAADGTPLHWLDTAQARGWIQAPTQPAAPLDARAIAQDWQDAHDTGFVGADAVLLACLRQWGALPRLSWGEAAVFAPASAHAMQQLDLYAIADDVSRLQAALDAGVRTVQLRIKRPAQVDTAWLARLREALASAIAAARKVGAQCFINDHWTLAAELGADAVHLGQEDLMALGEEGRRQLLARGVALGISSHSVWELCRARALSPRYIACGPVWPTTTKDMPWVPQGLDNLAWWCKNAGAPVVAIGGILAPAQARQAAAAGADGICLVRALGDAPAQVLPAFEQALAQGRRDTRVAPPRWPHPTLPVAASAS
jgi:hydroxymethylpyrimidine kinase/phosphomethylpyrimidine kinase/thiamine-phosphate diphosphorylase